MSENMIIPCVVVGVCNEQFVSSSDRVKFSMSSSGHEKGRVCSGSKWDWGQG